jgi:hypothetical protein
LGYTYAKESKHHDGKARDLQREVDQRMECGQQSYGQSRSRNNAIPASGPGAVRKRAKRNHPTDHNDAG